MLYLVFSRNDDLALHLSYHYFLFVYEWIFCSIWTNAEIQAKAQNAMKHHYGFTMAALTIPMVLPFLWYYAKLSHACGNPLQLPQFTMVSMTVLFSNTHCYTKVNPHPDIYNYLCEFINLVCICALCTTNLMQVCSCVKSTVCEGYIFVFILLYNIIL